MRPDQVSSADDGGAMLSQRDRQTLAEIENQLRASEPELVRSLERFRARKAPAHRRGATLRRAVGLTGAILGAALFAVAFVLHGAAFVVLAAAVILLDMVWWTLVGLGLLLRARRTRSRRG
jgi:fatty acid desaturase